MSSPKPNKVVLSFSNVPSNLRQLRRRYLSLRDYFLESWSLIRLKSLFCLTNSYFIWIIFHMNNISYKRFFKTLANEKRLKIIHYLQKNNSRNVSQIIKATMIEQTLVSHHLKRLNECRFVEVKQNGRERVYSLNKETIGPLLLLLDKHVNTYCANCKTDNHKEVKSND